MAPVSDSNWGKYFRPTPVSLWRSDLGLMGVSDHCYTRSDDLLAIRATGSICVSYAEVGGGGVGTTSFEV